MGALSFNLSGNQQVRFLLSFIQVFLFLAAGLFQPALRADVIITEFMADNDSVLADEDGDFSDDPRVPTEYLRSLFGDSVDEALITLQFDMEKKQEGKESRLMDLLIAKEWKSLFSIPDVKIY